MTLQRPATPAPTGGVRSSRREGGTVVAFVLGGALLLLAASEGRMPLQAALAGQPLVHDWLAVFVAIALQSFPFLVLGVVLAGLAAVYVPASVLRRVLPARPAAAVPVASAAGMLLPGCECGSVPLAGALVARGVAPAPALAFLLAAPAINPVVLVSTAVAFGGDWRVVLGRFTASLLTAVGTGWLWLRWGRDDLLTLPRSLHLEGGRLDRFTATVVHDLLHAGGFLVVGGAVAASVNVLLPRSVLDALAGHVVVAAVALALFAVVVAVCSEADAFVAASLTAFPLPARLVFMVVGPAIDLKLFAMQVGTFGRATAVRFAPLTLGVAVASALLVGEVLW